ncbi:nucleoside hydrolase [Kineosporia babensis]|uniref:Nucleoside hydrolase n=1 Tax=Kineosporia babensis TaxID=499548 RepID=A0A9X1NK24_9ACTN|nr:nucleoside hydrolase [Kineosporia babensis]
MKRRRVILNTDAKNEADDQYAIVHALLSPSLDVRGLIPAHFGEHRTTRSMEESREEIDRLLGLMGLDVPVANGASRAIPDEYTPNDSHGARLIIEESWLASGNDPLYIGFLGPLTDMASAILLDPTIVERPVVVIWIGGTGYDGLDSWNGLEFNLGNDIAAANVVMTSGITVWQIPRNVFSQVSVGYAELEEKLRGTSALADYLIDQLVEWNTQHHPDAIESRTLGDSPVVGLMLFPGGCSFRLRPAPRFDTEGYYVRGAGHPMRVIETVDVRFLLEDMFAKIRRFGRS